MENSEVKQEYIEIYRYVKRLYVIDKMDSSEVKDKLANEGLFEEDTVNKIIEIVEQELYETKEHFKSGALFNVVFGLLCIGGGFF